MSSTTSSRANDSRRRMLQNFLLIWIESNIDESTPDYRNALAQLYGIVNDVNVFTQRDEGIDFLTEEHGMRTFLIVDDTIGRCMMPVIHNIPALDTIYILSRQNIEHEEWTKDWDKIKGIHTDIKFICQALQIAEKQRNRDSIAVSFVTVHETAPNINLNQLEPSFMYTRIFKEIILQMNHDEKSIKDFIVLWRDHYININSTQNVITEFARDYCSQSSISWYTREYFIYQMLNRALRTLASDIIISMGFFIRDLHEQIEQLHRQQVSTYGHEPFIVYRGQGLSTTDFEKLQKTKGGLLSFNNFLSTSKDRDVSYIFADSSSANIDTIGVLYKITIDSSISSAPFAFIRDVSSYQTEEEVLFSMHTVFRICDITSIDTNSSIYQVDLQLTADDDEELRTHTKTIGEEVVGDNGWERLSNLLIKLNQFDKAEELYTILLEQTSDDSEKACYYNQLGFIKYGQGDSKKAIEYYEKALAIRQITLPPNDPLFATLYNNISGVHYSMGEYSKALSFCEKTPEIFEKTLPLNHPHLATSYNNIGLLYSHMGDYSKALSFDEKALEIRQKALPSNHPDFAIFYNNIGLLYKHMGEYLKALSFYEKALEIFEKTLPSNHPDFAQSYNNIGGVYDNMGDYAKALLFYEKALEIFEKTFPANHPDLATSYNNISSMYDSMGEYSKALSFYEKALEILQQTLPSNHPDFAQSCNNIGLVHYNMGEYSKALSFYERAVEIQQETLPPNHPHLAGSYNNIGSVYMDMEEYPRALSSHEKAFEIRQTTLPTNHPDLAQSYNNIGGVYDRMGEYSEALSFYKKALEILEKTLHSNHPHLSTSYNNIGGLYYKMGEYLKALSFYEKTLEIRQTTLPPNHSDFAQSYNNIGLVYKNTGEYSNALLFNEKALEIRQKTLPPNHPSLANSYNNIGFLYNNMGEHAKALASFQRTLNIFQSSLPAGHPKIQSVQEKIELLKQKM